MILGCLSVLACSGTSGSGAGTTVAAGPSGQPVRLDFTLKAVDGAVVDLKAFDGKIRVVDFWATWCPPCRMAIPHLNELHRKYRERGVAVLGISVDENPKVLAAFSEEVRIEYPSLRTSEQVEKAFGGIVGLPSTFVLDREGRVHQSYVGQMNPEDLENDIQALLAAK